MKRPIGLALIASMVLLGFITAFWAAAPENHPKYNPNDMLHFKPGQDFDREWQQVDSLIGRLRTQEAQAIVDKIYAAAQLEGNDPQSIKAILYTMKIKQFSDEESTFDNFDRMKAEIEKAGFPKKPLLQSLLAEHYSGYYLQNSWKFRDRTELEEEGNDPRTWSSNRIIEESRKLYLASLEQAEALLKVEIRHFSPILATFKGSDGIRPTLYDLLAHRALDFFEKDGFAPVQSANSFFLSGKDAFLPEEGFARAEFKTEDSLSHLLTSLNIFQSLSRAHLGNSRPSFFLHLRRLDFARSNNVDPDKNDYYLEALERLQKQHPDGELGAEVALRLAQFWIAQADANLEDSLYMGDRKKAMGILNPFLKGSDHASQNCLALADAIRQRSFSFEENTVVALNQPSLMHATYRNLSEAHFKIVALDKDAEMETDFYQEEFRNKVRGLPAIQAWSVQLPGSADYNPHRIDLPVPGLPAGMYALLASDKKDIENSSNVLVVHKFTVSDIAYVVRQTASDEHEVFVTDRTTGAPMEGVHVQVVQREYDYRKSRYIRHERESVTTNNAGKAVIKSTAKEYRYFYLKLTAKGQTLYSNDQWSQYVNNGNQDYRETRIVFFTDRAIYRPGQTVYFKGIVLDHFGKQVEIKPGFQSTVTFKDVNYEDVESKQFTSNEFGTFSGSFIAPKGQLNGQMHLEGHNGSVFFRVEDYKRPKFEVLADPVKGSFRLGEKVKVTGKATAYAGSSVDGATVNYRVYRTATYPYCYWAWWRPRPVSPEMEIAHGSVVTNPDGSFGFDFEAVPDRKVNPESKPQFNFQVVIDVVDITGETQSTETRVAVGHVALDASIIAPVDMQKGQAQTLVLKTLNLNGEFEPATGKIRIHKLKTPEVPLLERRGSVPDQFLTSEKEFHAKFPHHPYQDEGAEATWKTEKTVFDQAFDTQKQDSFILGDLGKWEEGVYRIVMETKDKFGTDLKVEHHVRVYSKESKNRVGAQFFKVFFPKSTLEPGQDAEMVLAAGEDGMQVLVEVEKKGSILSSEWVTLHQGTQSMKFPVKETDRGNFAVHFTTVRKGQVTISTHVVMVPWSNKKLTLDYSTFRSKLWPGQDEEWVIKVKGPAGEKVAAEMLAGMYDASLDVFATQSWGLYVNPSYYPQRAFSSNMSWSLGSAQVFADSWYNSRGIWPREFDHIQGWYDPSQGNYRMMQKSAMRNESANGWDEGGADEFGGEGDMEESVSDVTTAMPAPAAAEQPAGGALLPKEGKLESDGKDDKPGDKSVKIRTNLNETAFFFPHLRTNEDGDVLISFKMPEALTRWRFMALTHTKDLKVGYSEKQVVTQKDLMVMPNPPRFFRENDKIYFTAKISNLATTDLKGEARLELLDALTMQPVDIQFGNSQPKLLFEVKKGQSALVKWTLKVPVGFQAITYRVIAQAGSFSDGEEGALPVLTNSMLVTEAMPLPVRGKQTKSFVFDKLVNNKSATLRHHKYTLEFTSNPAWYAVQALPYMMEYPYECTEQTFSRYYANALASHIANKHPRIKQVFDTWASAPNSEALLSNLEKNQELKSLLLEETPWVMDATSESERKKRIALLFDLNRMADEQAVAIKKVQKAQVSNGAWPWFPGMPESRFITQHVVAGMGHLVKLGVTSVMEDADNKRMISKAVGYLDRRLAEDLAWLKKNNVDLQKENIGYDQIHLMYARSFFPEEAVEKGSQEAYAHYLKQMLKYWPNQGRYAQGMIALVLHRSGQTAEAKNLLQGLKQIATQSEEMGMYWKDIVGGWYWYQAPIETQALLIEGFHEVLKDAVSVEEMKLWLLKQKQTQDWKTTKATVDATYAMLLTGMDWLSESQLAQVSVGSIDINPSTRPDLKAEAGTGYFKTSWSASEIRPEMGKVKVTNPNQVAAWGAVYWQYFEQLENITGAKTNIVINKELYKQENTDKGPKLVLMAPGTPFKQGDLVKVRMIIKTDRDMEYVHIKDMRGAGFEPVDVLSLYKWQDGLGYYQTTRDAATNFFIDYLRKGTYVFEYPLRATHEGDFSNGITSIQCMYAPEFTAHSKGVRVQIGM